MAGSTKPRTGGRRALRWVVAVAAWLVVALLLGLLIFTPTGGLSQYEFLAVFTVAAVVVSLSLRKFWPKTR